MKYISAGPTSKLKSLLDYCKEHSTVYRPCVVRHWTGRFYTISVNPTADYIKEAYLDIYMNNQWTINSTRVPVLVNWLWFTCHRTLDTRRTLFRPRRPGKFPVVCRAFQWPSFDTRCLRFKRNGHTGLGAVCGEGVGRGGRGRWR